MLKKLYYNGGNYVLYFLLFNIAFLLFWLSLKFAIPFVISLLLSIWLHPLANFISNKTKIKKELVNLLCIILSIFIVIGGLALIGTGMLKETSDIVGQLSEVNIGFIPDKIEQLKVYIEMMPSDIVDNINAQLQGLATSLIGYVAVLGNWVLKVASLIPTGTINLIIVVLSTYYLMRDHEVLATKFENFMIGKNELPRNLLKRANSIIINYIQSYSILLSITFIECMIVFSVFDIKYKFTLSILCVFLDILPIVGSAIIYIPIVIIFLIQGEIVSAIWIMILYIAFMVIRNILEPKLLSKSLEIHPVLILMSIYIGLAVYGILGIIYCIFLIAYFKLLKEMEVV
ncbi:AI-2E family transporter [Clostridium sp. AL.422]|uniref:AI-2E family transporter n=1 Tax=Clostridium TaxID=1485 RepID=UPI00293DFDE9|nr:MULTISPECIES: AI-2E family transporter [unclassified Clostridium]MDV4150527.1 AI-2E family transporter [Clostridium sp. AL.422]